MACVPKSKVRHGSGWERVALFTYQYLHNQTLTRELVAGGGFDLCISHSLALPIVPATLTRCRR
jgi:hypothetical protein